MKKIFTLISLILLLQSIHTVAQPYQSIFGTFHTAWKHRSQNEFGVSNDSFFIQKDTIINGINYKKIVEPSLLWPGGLLREDVNTGTVWYRNIVQQGGDYNDSFDRVISRMDLNVGDTFDISNTHLGIGTYPDSMGIIDSIRYVNGLKHIYFKGICDSYPEPYMLIEGVTSNLGILWKHSTNQGIPFSSSKYLLCSYKDGVKTAYENVVYQGACHDYSDVPEVDNARTLKIYPNPVSDVFFIKAAKRINKVLIVDLDGRIIKEVNNSDITDVSLSNLVKGVYFLKLFTSDGQYIVRNIIKN